MNVLNATELFTLKWGNLRHVNSVSLKTSFWGSLSPQFLAEGLTAGGPPSPQRPQDQPSPPALSLPGPVSHLPCPTHRPECSRWGTGTDVPTSRRKVHDPMGAYKVQKPGVLSEGRGGHAGVQGRFMKWPHPSSNSRSYWHSCLRSEGAACLCGSPAWLPGVSSISQECPKPTERQDGKAP